MMELIYEALTIYSITLILTKGSILAPARKWLKTKIALDIECRMCVGFWVAIAVCLAYGSPNNILPAYAASYFMVTQERD